MLIYYASHNVRHLPALLSPPYWRSQDYWLREASTGSALNCSEAMLLPFSGPRHLPEIWTSSVSEAYIPCPLRRFYFISLAFYLPDFLPLIYVEYIHIFLFTEGDSTNMNHF